MEISTTYETDLRCDLCAGVRKMFMGPHSGLRVTRQEGKRTTRTKGEGAEAQASSVSVSNMKFPRKEDVASLQRSVHLCNTWKKTMPRNHICFLLELWKSHRNLFIAGKQASCASDISFFSCLVSLYEFLNCPYTSVDQLLAAMLTQSAMP